MTPKEKQKALKKYKMIATGLLALMAIVFFATFLMPDTTATGYIRAFSEAAMVGALADWFAVTALFKHPLGLPIPHTNLIESNKKNIGENLGNFISDNFLTPENIRPRIEKLQLAGKLGNWLQKPTNRNLIIEEITRIAEEALEQIKDEEMEQVIGKQLQNLITQFNAGSIAGDTLKGILEKGIHQDWITLLTKNAAAYIASNAQLVKEKVKEESHILIPGFVDNIIASKISKGLQGYLAEISQKPDHPQRAQITQRLYQLANDMKVSEEWKERFTFLKTEFLPSEKLQLYSNQLWQYLKKYLQENLSKNNGPIQLYLDKTIANIAGNYLYHSDRSQKLDLFFQVQAFKIIMRHREDVARLISTTVSNWESKSLSQKLALEVGKDLQFIRLNGTLVGGLVGLIIHAISLWI